MVGAIFIVQEGIVQNTDATVIGPGRIPDLKRRWYVSPWLEITSTKIMDIFVNFLRDS